MTSLLMNGSAALPAMAVGLRFWLARLGALIGRAVSARAARAVPEWQMRQVQSDIRRYLRQIRHAGR